MTGVTSPEFHLTLPEAEATQLREAYAGARVILEYGSGGSTLLAAGLPGKRVFAVESDADWALRLQARIDADDLPSPATIWHVDIGPTGNWGRPVAPAQWPRFHRYPVAIWNESFFRHPDVVLIDGRFRPACLMAVLALCRAPVTVLFDDYSERPAYHMVEEVITPARMVGRMAVFQARPGLIALQDLALLNRAFAQATFVDDPQRYDLPAFAESPAPPTPEGPLP